MNLNFPSEELREICEKRSVATAELGTTAALELAQKLADIEACANVEEFCSLYPLEDVSPNEKRLRIGTSHCLTLRSGHPTYPEPPPEVTDWNKTTRVRIVSIEATNG